MFLDDVSFVIIHLNFRGGDKKGASWKSEHCLAPSLQGDACVVIRLTEERSQIDFTNLGPKKSNLIVGLTLTMRSNHCS